MTRPARQSTRLLAAALAVIAGLAPLAAHQGATGIVKQRMEAMKAVGKAMKTVDQMVRGKIKYDAEAVKAQARVIKGHAGEALTKLFPKGSLDHPTEATAKIWDEWEGFKALADRLAAYAGALEAAADNPRQHMMGREGGATGPGPHMNADGWPDADHLARMPPHAVVKHMVDVCRACHDAYRKKKP